MKDPSSSHLKEAWVLCFILGIIMLNYPFLHIFNKERLVFDIPLLILYLLVGWPISILVIYLFTRSLKNNSNNHNSKPDSHKGKKEG
jgi:predicted membrane protein